MTQTPVLHGDRFFCRDLMVVGPLKEEWRS